MATAGDINGDFSTVTSFSANTLLATQVTMIDAGVVHDIFVNGGGTVSGNNNAMCALYADSGLGHPGALIAASSDVWHPAATETGVFSINATITTPGTYWVCVLFDAIAGPFSGMFNLTQYGPGSGLILSYSQSYAGGFPSSLGSGTGVSTYNYATALIFTPTDLTPGTYLGEITGGAVPSAIGGSAFNTNQVWVIPITPPASGQITGITYYMKKTLGSPFVSKFVIYDDFIFMGNHRPHNLLGITAEVNSFSVNQNTVSFSSPISVTGGQIYYIGTFTPDLMPTFQSAVISGFITSQSYTSGAPNPFGTAALAGFGPPTFWADFSVSPVLVSISARVTALAKSIPNIIPVLFRSSALWRTDTNPSAVSTYNEGGIQLGWVYETVLLPDNLVMSENMIIETDLSMSFLGSQPVVTVTASDTNDQILNSVGINAGQTDTLWNAFKWNGAPWNGTETELSSWDMAWTLPLVFKQIKVTATGTSETGFQIGNLYMRYQVLGYLQQLDSGVR